MHKQRPYTLCVYLIDLELPQQLYPQHASKPLFLGYPPWRRDRPTTHTSITLFERL